MNNTKGQLPALPLRRPRGVGTVALILLSLVAWTVIMGQKLGDLKDPDTAQDLPGYESLTGHCSQIPPIAAEEYSARQSALAKALRDIGPSSANNIYVAEPGASTQFFANFSQATWKLSERPLLLVISSSGQINVLTPKFEVTRSKQLPLPNHSEIRFVAWPEEDDPYSVLLSVVPVLANSTIYVDNSIRKFIVDGLERAQPGVRVKSAPPAITELRERKTETELAILKCANEATVLAIRHVHRQLHIGVKESEARAMMANALSAAGLVNGGCLTLFGDNAALPHGSGSDRSLSPVDFALFDCTASLHGYQSDVTRTVALPASQIPGEHLRIWEGVREAQRLALAAAKAGVLAKNVDLAARQSLVAEGYGDYFTHRLGHGIGLEGHEPPYLRGKNEDVLEIGHTFSNEPGVYIEGKLGVRLEDCFYINTEGTSSYLTSGVGGPSESPWKP